MSNSKNTNTLQLPIDAVNPKFGRSKVFHQAQAWKLGQKTIRAEFQAMLEEAMDQKMEYDASIPAPVTNLTLSMLDLESYKNLLTEFDYVSSPLVTDLDHDMERTIQNLQSKYAKAMSKLKNANLKQQDLKIRNLELSTVNFQLSSKNVIANVPLSDDETEDRKQENMNTNFFLFWFLSWILGAVFRYSILFPLRLLVLMKTVLFTLAQFWLWDKVFPNDPQTLER